MTDLLPPAPVTKTDKIRCLERELRQRAKVYPRLIETHRMRQEQADREVQVMQTILKDYDPEWMP